MPKAKSEISSQNRRRTTRKQSCPADEPPATKKQSAAEFTDSDSRSLEHFVVDSRRCPSSRGQIGHGAGRPTGCDEAPTDHLSSAPAKLSAAVDAVSRVAKKDTPAETDRLMTSHSDADRSKAAWPHKGLPPLPIRGLCSSSPERRCTSWQRLRCGAQLSHATMRRECGLSFAFKQNRQDFDLPVLNRLGQYKVHYQATPFMRRVTAMAWHPLLVNLLAVGSKGGELVLWRVDKEQQPQVTDLGIGPGGVVQAMKFWPPWENSLLSATMDSGLVLRDLECRSHRILFNSVDPYERWFCSVDASANVIAGGESSGQLVLLSAKDGLKTFSARLHKNKINYLEFSPKDEYLLCTASVDRTVRMWDIRQMKDKSSALCELPHDRGINSACFSRTDGCRLLTTDQYDQLRVYRGPDWQLEHTIEHPHRFFQHLTPIKASWHPLVDVAIIGRYPYEKDGMHMRRLDMYRADNSELTCFLRHSDYPGITSLNYFNPTAEYLASGTGSTVVIWKQELSVPDEETHVPTTPAAGPSNGGTFPKDSKAPPPNRPKASKQEAAAAKAKLARKE